MSRERIDASKASMEEEGERYLTMKQVTARYNLSKWSVYDLIRMGRLKQYVPYPGSRMVRYKVSELEAMMETKE